MAAYPPPPTPALAEPDPPVAAVPELAVQLAWARGHLDARGLRTTDGEPVSIIDPGHLNTDSGPDLSHAVVQIGSLIWSGDVEVHRTSAEWRAHGHHRDPAYDRVVLHVVLSPDRTTGALRRADGSRLPELVVLPHLSLSLADLVVESRTGAPGPPCTTGRLPDPPAGWLAELGARRLASRATALTRQFEQRPDLDVLLSRRVFRALGYHANADAMETLASRQDLGELRALASPERIADHLLRASGLAPAELGQRDPEGAMPARSWRRGGRPANAPRVRIVQAARLLAPGGVLARGGLDRLREQIGDSPQRLLDALRCPADDLAPRLGAARARDIVLNAVLPVLLVDAELRGDPTVQARAVALARALPAPSDRVLRDYAAAGLQAATALDALGVHTLAEELCAEGRCARCAIGRHLAPGLVRRTG